MIKPKLADEIKFELHGYLYARREDMTIISERLTQLFRTLAAEGMVHNVLHRTSPVLWEKEDHPIFDNEGELPDHIDEKDRWIQICKNETLDMLERVQEMIEIGVAQQIYNRVVHQKQDEIFEEEFEEEE